MFTHDPYDGSKVPRLEEELRQAKARIAELEREVAQLRPYATARCQCIESQVMGFRLGNNS